MRLGALVALLVAVSSASEATGQAALYRGYTLSINKVTKKSKIAMPPGAGYDLVPMSRDERFLEIEVGFVDPGGADLEWPQKDLESGMTLAQIPAREIQLSPFAPLIDLSGKTYAPARNHGMRFDKDKRKGRIVMHFTVPKDFVPVALQIGKVLLTFK